MNKSLTHEELQKQSEGVVVKMGCANCEGFEEHKKVNDEWVCQWCGKDERVKR